MERRLQRRNPTEGQGCVDRVVWQRGSLVRYIYIFLILLAGVPLHNDRWTSRYIRSVWIDAVRGCSCVCVNRAAAVCASTSIDSLGKRAAEGERKGKQRGKRAEPRWFLLRFAISRSINCLIFAVNILLCSWFPSRRHLSTNLYLSCAINGSNSFFIVLLRFIVRRKSYIV